MDHYKRDLAIAFCIAVHQLRRLGRDDYAIRQYRVSVEHVERSMGNLHPDSTHYAQVTMRSGTGSWQYCGGCVASSNEEIYAQLELIERSVDAALQNLFGHFGARARASDVTPGSRSRIDSLIIGHVRLSCHSLDTAWQENRCLWPS